MSKTKIPINFVPLETSDQTINNIANGGFTDAHPYIVLDGETIALADVGALAITLNG